MVGERWTQDRGSVGPQLGVGSSVGVWVATLIWVPNLFPERHGAVSPWANEPISGLSFLTHKMVQCSCKHSRRLQSVLHQV